MNFRQKITLSLLLYITLCLPLFAQVVDIPDPNLRVAIRDALNLATGTPITQADIRQLTKLEARGEQIKDLSGLQHAINITKIDFGENDVSNLSPLAALTQLEFAELRRNPISDLSPLANLPQLHTLFVWECQISDISPLANLTQLTYLDLSYNRIVDIRSLADLTRLTELVIRGNEIADITPLANLIDLELLWIQRNNIVDIRPLANLTQLTELVLSENEIADVTPLANLTNLERLELQHNRITDVTPLENLTNLEYLDTQNNPIFDPDSPLVDIPDPNLRAAIHETLQRPEHLPLDEAAMLQFTNLDIHGRGVANLGGLEYAHNMDVLVAGENPISDLGPLANLTKLVRLFVWRCEISDIRPLAKLINLQHLDLRWNRIVDISPLSGMTQLIGLALNYNRIEGVAPLANLLSLEDLDVSHNKIVNHLALGGLSLSDFRYDQTCEMAPIPVRDRIENRSYPSIFSRWTVPVLPLTPNRPELSDNQNIARHDLWFGGPWFGLRFEYWPDTIRVFGDLDNAIRRRDDILAINPNAVFLVYVRMRHGKRTLPEDSPHWIRDAQGNIVEGDLMDFTHPYIQDRIVQHAIAVSKCGLYDGIMFDWWNEHGPVLTTPHDPYRGNEVEQRARDSILQRIRAGTRPDFLIMGNTNHRIIPRTGAHINGGFMEVSIPGTRSAINIEESRSGLPVVEHAVRWLDQNLREPRISGLEGRGIIAEPSDSPANRRWMRAITTLSLTHSDGYVTFRYISFENTRPGTYIPMHDWSWYDFWDADLGRPVGEKAQLYQGTDGLYIREYTNGWAVYNHSGAPQVIRLPEEVHGVASGLVNVEHALANLDGEMYLKAVESGEGRVESKNPADVNGDGVVNILDLTLVAQGFGTDGLEGDVNGDGVINVFDLVFVANEL